MPRSRTQPADTVHYDSGFTGTLKWMGYWTASRSANARRAILRQWRSHLRPALSEHSASVTTRVRTAIHESVGGHEAAPYNSLAEAVRQRQLMDARG